MLGRVRAERLRQIYAYQGFKRNYQGAFWGRELVGPKFTQVEAIRTRPSGRVVPQNPTLPPAFLAAEVVLFGRTPHLKFMESEKAQDWEAVRQAMEQASCWELADRRVGELSGGERQRVLFALALAQEPLSFAPGRANNFSGHQLPDRNDGYCGSLEATTGAGRRRGFSRLKFGGSIL